MSAMVMLVVGLVALWYVCGWIVGDGRKDKENKSEAGRVSVPRARARTRPVLDVVRFRYCDRNGQETERTVEVYTGKRLDYFRGHCRLRGKERMFYFSRIIGDEVVRLETGEVMSIEGWRRYLKAV